jgi:phosphatidylglycerol:prolipoprotein diacylglycerol transferase
VHPTLFELLLFGRTFAIDARGLFIALGAVLALLVFGRQARSAGLDKIAARQLGLTLLLIGLICARALFLLWHAPAYVAHCAAAREALDDATLACVRPLWAWEGGLSPVGGMSLVFVWLLWRARRLSLSPLRIADLAAAPLALGYAVGRVGCFLTGCCFGRATSSVFGVRFPLESVAFQTLFDQGRVSMSEYATPPLHPVQLYAAVANAILFVALVLAGNRGAHREGARFFAFLAGSAAITLALAPFYDPTAHAPAWLSLSMLAGLSAIAFAARGRASLRSL